MASELQIRNAIVALIQGVTGAGRVYNRLRNPSGALLSELQVLTVDDANKINVVFVRRVSFNDEIDGIPPEFISSSEVYELWFYRGVVDATDGTDSESEFQLFIENVRAAFTLFANVHLGFDATVNVGGMSTASPLINTDEIGGFLCHRFIGRLNVSREIC